MPGSKLRLSASTIRSREGSYFRRESRTLESVEIQERGPNIELFPTEIRYRILGYAGLELEGLILWKPRQFRAKERELKRFERNVFIHLTGFKCLDKVQRIPYNLFRVTKAIHEDAKAIFFARNHFMILGPVDQKLRLLRRVEVLNAPTVPSFLRSIPSPLAYLRELHLNFEVQLIFQMDSQEDSEAARSQLQSMVRLIEHNCDVPKLALYLHFDNPWDMVYRNERLSLEKALGDVMTSFRILRELRALFCFFGRDWDHHEIVQEKRIMGSAYQSLELGKEKVDYSQMFIPVHAHEYS